ncbi:MULTISPECIES: polysaccharide biosynthesis C-terminal domain-containing protein [unclassified Leifsonia]|uniref:polysaccharide biosynthesis C-terminal domain-containing protein n=1 Tax=unclassified Leifsonia TaxID=2663824 RepID=UPI00070155D6|nr:MULTISPECIES: NAD-dependent epimerase/dehydratase family protein [unclassified Leifsonia]KQX05664.1 capsular biosynthesis protein [Leifsonia sp. Root1293]KRA09300.1 capsular biosynthesis protein [Leifsonia sp. Root60]
MDAARVALTGSGGFLGWHTRAALAATGVHVAAIGLGTDFDEVQASELVAGCDRVIHLAGVNRGSDNEITDGNVQFARQLLAAMEQAEVRPGVVTFANSVQAGNGTVYGYAKKAAGAILRDGCAALGIAFEDVELPNIFGEHGRPFYNSVFATFSTLIAGGGSPVIDVDKELVLVHAQDAVDVLTGAAPLVALSDRSRIVSVRELSGLLEEMGAVYASGEIPDISSPFRRDVFNAYRSYTVPGSIPIGLHRHADARGSFFEILKSRGGTGQTSFSTTVPGVTRGDHFHRRKVERFVVLSGRAVISLRRLFSNEVISIEIDGDDPVAVDMPTMWSHNIRNTGSQELYTAFWTNDLFDPLNPDTFAEAV